MYCFDPRLYRTTSLGYEKTGFRRLKFLCESLSDLKSTLQSCNSDLDILIGRPEEILGNYIKQRDLQECTLFMHDEIAFEERSTHEAIKKSLSRQFSKMSFEECTGGSTLITIEGMDSIGFNLDDLNGFTPFRKKVEATSLLTDISPLPPISSYKPILSIAEGAKDDASTETVSVPYLSSGASYPNQIDMSSLWTHLRELGSQEVQCYSPAAESVGGCRITKSVAVSAIPCIQASNVDEILGNLKSDGGDDDYDSKSAIMGLTGGETKAWQRVQEYITEGTDKLSIYKQTRNGMIGTNYSSKLSIYLASGLISAQSVYHAVKEYESKSGIANESTYWLIFELLWRDFFHFYERKHDKKMFYLGGPQGKKGRDKYPWGSDIVKLNAWREGRTGYPIIDANMRELLYTGFMSNRGRQIVASFLVRDLKQDWRYGAEHFERCLIDHDVNSNWGNWNYGAGVGADPREDRYFNIVKQGKDYDPGAEYIRLWCPELAHLPNRVLLDPRIITPKMREEFDIGTDVLPNRICQLAMDDGSLPPRGGPGSNNKGKGNKKKGGPFANSNKSSGGKQKKFSQQHGFVPGR